MSRIAWEAPEFEHRPKGPMWYWVSMIVALVLLGAAVWQRNFFFAVFIVIAEVLLIVWGSYEPRKVKFEVSEHGLHIDGKRYPIRELRSFSADIEGMLDADHPELIIHFDHHFRPALRIKVPARWLPEVRKTLRHHIPEEHFEPGFVEVLEKYLGF